VRYRTAAILSAVLIGGMVGLPAAVWAILLGIAVVCGSWSWIPRASDSIGAIHYCSIHPRENPGKTLRPAEDDAAQ